MASDQTTASKESKLRHRPTSATASSAAAAASSPTYTEEQIKLVRQINQKKDYYDILGLERRNCSVEDVRKAYRKLSLKLHPDKNQAPGAEEAFKALSEAFQCLSNGESRNKYDKEYDVTGRGGGGRFQNGGFDADEILRRQFCRRGSSPGWNWTFKFNFGEWEILGGRRAGTGGDKDNGFGFNFPTLILAVVPVAVVLLLNFLPSSDDPIIFKFKSSDDPIIFKFKYSQEGGVNK